MLGKRIHDVIDMVEEFFTGDEKLDYLEPFVGFCGVMKHFGKEGDRKLTGCDANKNVISMWKALQRGWKPPTKCDKNTYELLKQSTKVSPEKGFIGVACSYSGIYFVGYRGTQTYNKSRGRGAKVVESAEMTARSVVKMTSDLKKVRFSVCDYQKLRPKDKLIYCDPPYATNKYQQSKFFDFDSEKFWQIMREWSRDNIVIISEYKAPADFKCIWQSKINVIHNGKQNAKVEKLFMYKDDVDEFDATFKKELKMV